MPDVTAEAWDGTLTDSKFATLVGGSLLKGRSLDPNGSTVACAGVNDEACTFLACSQGSGEMKLYCLQADLKIYFPLVLRDD